MAIDMIENNELAALAPSRLGLHQFVDEGYRNYTGSDGFFGGDDDNFANLFGSRKKKLEKYSSWARAKFDGLPTDCENIQNSIDIINNELAALLKQKQSLNTKTQVNETNLILADFKKMQITQNCEKIASEQKAAKEKEETISTLTQLSDQSVSKAQSELAGLQGANSPEEAAQQEKMKKYLLYGGIGVAALIVLVLIVKK